MTAALLCPGPSLLDTFPGRAGYLPVIAVNRAGVFCPDWLAALDEKFLRAHGPTLPAANLLTSGTTHAALAGTFWGSRPTIITEDLREFCPAPGWTLYSATSALVLAAWVGAKSIDVYGADWSGELDWDGTAAGENRSAARWRTERQVWEGLVTWLAGRGVSVARVHEAYSP